MFPALLLAGGLGTRVVDLTGGTQQKAMLRVCDRPFIDFKLPQLAVNGVREVIVLVGHGAEQLNTSAAVRLAGCLYRTSRIPRVCWGLAALCAPLGIRFPRFFWLRYADSYLPEPMEPIGRFYRSQPLPALMTILRNRDRWGRSALPRPATRLWKYRNGARRYIRPH